VTDPSPQSLTPVGDWLRRRYPAADGTTHWEGSDGDPGCCAGPHATCLYGAAFREGTKVERDRLWSLPVTQRLELDGAAWRCAGCRALLIAGSITHLPRCSEMGEQ
jgi:hypothetical protein